MTPRDSDKLMSVYDYLQQFQSSASQMMAYSALLLLTAWAYFWKMRIEFIRGCWGGSSIAWKGRRNDIQSRWHHQYRPCSSSHHKLMIKAITNSWTKVNPRLPIEEVAGQVEGHNTEAETSNQWSPPTRIPRVKPNRSGTRYKSSKQQDAKKVRRITAAC